MSHSLYINSRLLTRIIEPKIDKNYLGNDLQMYIENKNFRAKKTHTDIILPLSCTFYFYKITLEINFDF